MRNYQLAILIVASLMACQPDRSATEEYRLLLPNGYSQVQNIIAVADCSSPMGPYTTEVHSANDGYMFFKQAFADGEFAAVLKDDQGYVLDPVRGIADTLSASNISMIAGHAFHQIHIRPEQYFQDIAYDTTARYRGAVYDRYAGSDTFGRPVQLYYQPAESLIAGYVSVNPVDTTQTIEVYHKSWQSSDFGPLVQSLEIVQAQTDTFTFDFTSVRINRAEFEELTIE